MVKQNLGFMYARIAKLFKRFAKDHNLTITKFMVWDDDFLSANVITSDNKTTIIYFDVEENCVLFY